MTPGMAIVKRELLTTLRSPRPFYFLVMLLLLMGADLVFVIEAVIGNAQVASGQVDPRDIQALFLTFTLLFYGAAVLLVPPLAAISICGEKQQDTLDMLKMTWIRPRTLALAKLANVLGVYALMLIAALPIMGVSFFLVGIDWTQFVVSLAILSAATLSGAAIGLPCSAWFNRTAPAIVTAYIGVFFLHGGLVVLLFIAVETLMPATGIAVAFGRVAEDVIAITTPFYLLAEVGSGFRGADTLLGALIYQIVLLALGLRLTHRLLARPTRPPRVNPDKPIDDAALLESRRRTFPYYLLDPRRRRPMIPDHRNPVYVKERQTSLAGTGAWRIRIAYVFGCLCFLLAVDTVWTLLEDPRFGRSAFTPPLLEAIIILVFVPPAIGLTMAKEYEWGNVDMLRMTLLSPGTIAAGKFGAAAASLLPLLAGLLFGAIPLAIVGYSTLPGDLVAVALTLAYTIALVAAVTAGARHSANALLLGFGAVLLAHVAVPYGALWVIEFTVPRYFEITIEDAGAGGFFSPLWARTFANSLWRYGYTVSGLEYYWLWHVLIFLPLTLILMRIARWRFRRHFKRS